VNPQKVDQTQTQPKHDDTGEDKAIETFLRGARTETTVPCSLRIQMPFSSSQATDYVNADSLVVALLYNSTYT